MVGIFESSALYFVGGDEDEVYINVSMISGKASDRTC